MTEAHTCEQLAKVVTQLLNPRPVDRKSNTLPIAPPCHLGNGKINCGDGVGIHRMRMVWGWEKNCEDGVGMGMISKSVSLFSLGVLHQ